MMTKNDSKTLLLCFLNNDRKGNDYQSDDYKNNNNRLHLPNAVDVLCH